MKKLLLMASILISTVAFSQLKPIESPVNISVGLVGSYPIGILHDSYSYGAGFVGQIELKAKKDQFLQNTSYVFTSGYTGYVGKVIGNKRASFKQVPLLMGFKYNITKNVYTMASAGVSFFNQGLGTQFSYSPLVGIRYEKFSLDCRWMSSILPDTKGGSSLSSLDAVVSYRF